MAGFLSIPPLAEYEPPVVGRSVIKLISPTASKNPENLKIKGGRVRVTKEKDKMNTLEEKERDYKVAQATCEKAETDYENAREVMPERLAYIKAQTIRNRAWEAYIKAGG